MRRLSPNSSASEIAQALNDLKRDLDRFMAAPPRITGDLDMAGYRLTNVGNPQEANDAAVKRTLTGSSTDGTSGGGLGGGGSGGGGSSGGDVDGPSVAVSDNFAQFDGTSGKLIKDGGFNPSSFHQIDPQLTSLAALTYTGNAGKVVAVKGTEDTFELVSPGGSGIGDVVGPGSATDSHFAQFDGGSGKLLKDGGYQPSSFSPAFSNSSQLAALLSDEEGTGAFVLNVGPNLTVPILNAADFYSPSFVPSFRMLDSTGTFHVKVETASDPASNTTLYLPLSGTLATQSFVSAGYQPLDADLTSWAAITRASGFDTFVATPSSANLAALVTGETGTAGSLVFSIAPTFTGTAHFASADFSSLTSGRVPFATTAGLLTDDAGLLYNSSTDVLTSGAFEQQTNNAGGFTGKGALANDYRFYVNNSNNWVLNVNVGGALSGVYAWSTAGYTPTGRKLLGQASNSTWSNLYLSGATSGYTDLIAPAVAGSGTQVTLPASAGTLARTDGDAIGATTPASGKFTTLQRRAGTSSGYGGGVVLLDAQYTTVGNVGGGEDDLMTYTLPANALATDGDFVRITAGFSTAANANDKRVRIKFGGSDVWDSTQAAYNPAVFTATVTIIRDGSGTQLSVAHASSTSSLMPSTAMASINSALAITDTAAIIIKGTGQSFSSVDNDAKQWMMLVEYGSLN